MTDRLRLLQVGAGSMGRAWLDAIRANPDVELAGLVDLDAELARTAAGDPGVVTGDDLAAVLTRARPHAMINVTIPEAHRPTTVEALEAGLPVLCEKPIAPTVEEARAMVEAAERTGRLLMVSQSRRYSPELAAFRRLIARIGAISTVNCQFFKAPHFGGFREEMAEPLLVDMAIHQFDLARLLTGADPVSVSCDSYNPPWSWFAGNAAAEASFVLADRSRFTFSGSWCAPGLETSWNGSWRVVGAEGTATWDGAGPPAAELTDGTALKDEVGAEPESIAGSLAEFVHCVRAGTRPDSAAARNIVSLAMVEAAVRSSAEKRTVTIAEVLSP
ncbi:Gfo/Idh/MocA family oxidoreductase [Actinoplanes sp. NBRC 103695]|uniref:Gfo/Idh/MocA family protein n=1 Tax=Actinoplanes sp. NBRC 103695 TaxID=3032202 RepID=UPI0024A1467E|nr:Gfo/Idh/MocA family oxidoreductase [Actinoplanes sp. NBRC 103695]GLZ00533.1 dehydrogenase [Actinoplanes sp. NBRC 103695]